MRGIVGKKGLVFIAYSEVRLSAHSCLLPCTEGQRCWAVAQLRVWKHVSCVSNTLCLACWCFYIFMIPMTSTRRGWKMQSKQNNWLCPSALCPPPQPSCLSGLWAFVCLSEICTGSPHTLPIPLESAHFSRTLNKLIWALIIQGAYFITFDSAPPTPAAANPHPPPAGCNRRRPEGGAVPGNLAHRGAA